MGFDHLVKSLKCQVIGAVWSNRYPYTPFAFWCVHMVSVGPRPVNVCNERRYAVWSNRYHAFGGGVRGLVRTHPAFPTNKED